MERYTEWVEWENIRVGVEWEDILDGVDWEDIRDRVEWQNIRDTGWIGKRYVKGWSEKR